MADIGVKYNASRSAHANTNSVARGPTFLRLPARTEVMHLRGLIIQPDINEQLARCVTLDLVNKISSVSSEGSSARVELGRAPAGHKWHRAAPGAHLCAFDQRRPLFAFQDHLIKHCHLAIEDKFHNCGPGPSLSLGSLPGRRLAICGCQAKLINADELLEMFVSVPI